MTAPRGAADFTTVNEGTAPQRGGDGPFLHFAALLTRFFRFYSLQMTLETATDIADESSAALVARFVPAPAVLLAADPHWLRHRRVAPSDPLNESTT
jgi:hypothetical protein